MDENDKLLGQLRHVTVCQVADGLGPLCAVENTIRPLDPRFRICGPALTVECPAGDNLTVHHALHLARPGDVLVVGGSANGDAAMWGELMSISARAKGLLGTIVDGAARDPIEIQSLGYPVFCRSIHPGRAAKERYGRINVPIRIGGLPVNPQDVILADANGIVALPPALVSEAVLAASEVVKKERSAKEQILAGRTIFEIFEMARYVPRDRQHPAKAK